jgi:hypothetical protein
MQLDRVVIAPLVGHGDAMALSRLRGEQRIGSRPGLAVDRPAIIALVAPRALSRRPDRGVRPVKAAGCRGRRWCSPIGNRIRTNCGVARQREIAAAVRHWTAAAEVCVALWRAIPE